MCENALAFGLGFDKRLCVNRWAKFLSRVCARDIYGRIIIFEPKVRERERETVRMDVGESECLRERERERERERIEFSGVKTKQAKDQISV